MGRYCALCTVPTPIFLAYPSIKPMNRFAQLSAALLLGATVLAHAAGRDLVPTSDAQVIEALPARVRTSANTPEAAAIAARQAISLARQTADPRYLGRAQATLARWWDQPDAPTELAVLQATVLQSRHAFDAARSVLNQALQRDANHAQGWLTLATLERVAGNYPAAMAACSQVARAGAALYATACQLETSSLQGRYDEARRGLEALRLQTPDAATQGWLLSLQAESNERAGRDALALSGYQASLALAPDGYTALAAADLLLRMGRAEEAQKMLTGQPNSDAVLLRRAHAAKMLNNPHWQSMAKELRDRFAALDNRGDNPATHARELALNHLWLAADGTRALQAAKLNLTLQKEPFDWWLAMASAELAAQPAELERLRQQLVATGLRDARLARWQTKPAV
jgi:tetratricopeptide (TPR) repeat protein